MNTRFFTVLTALYPRAWRERYAAELADLGEEFLASGETTRLRLAAGIVVAASIERVRAVRGAGHRLVIGAGATLIVGFGAVILAGGGFGLFTAPSPTKGPIPRDAYVNGRFDASKVPDFIALGNNQYVRKADLFPPRPNGSAPDPRLISSVPVFARDLKTLVGHMYLTGGFLPLDVAASSQPCVPVSTVANGQSSLIPCASHLVTLPNVVGMVTPTGIARLSSLGVSVTIMSVQSASATPGHIVAISPSPGTGVQDRSPVIVEISTRAARSAS